MKSESFPFPFLLQEPLRLTQPESAYVVSLDSCQLVNESSVNESSVITVAKRQRFGVNAIFVGYQL